MRNHSIIILWHHKQPDSRDPSRTVKIIFFSHFDLLRPTTNKISDIRFCEGFAENGADIRHVGPYVYRRSNTRRSHIFRSYGVEHPFPITLLWTPFFENSPGWVTGPIFSAAALCAFTKFSRSVSAQGNKMFVVSRDVNSLWILMQTARIRKRDNVRFIFWAHEVRLNHPRYAHVVRTADAVLATNTAILDDLELHFGIPRARGFVTYNPVSTRQLVRLSTKQEARAQINIVSTRPLVVYTGKLAKGITEIRYILESAARLPTYDFLFTGGKPDVVAHFSEWCEQNRVTNVRFTGFLHDYTQIADYQLAADVLVSYYTRNEHLVDYNYPQKLTEYMLTGNPIVTPDYRATRDILHADNCIFSEPESTAALTDAIRFAIENKEHSSRLARRAYDDVQSLTFRAVTGRLITFLESLP